MRGRHRWLDCADVNSVGSDQEDSWPEHAEIQRFPDRYCPAALAPFQPEITHVAPTSAISKPQLQPTSGRTNRAVNTTNPATASSTQAVPHRSDRAPRSPRPTTEPDHTDHSESDPSPHDPEGESARFRGSACEEQEPGSFSNGDHSTDDGEGNELAPRLSRVHVGGDTPTVSDDEARPADSPDDGSDNDTGDDYAAGQPKERDDPAAVLQAAVGTGADGYREVTCDDLKMGSPPLLASSIDQVPKAMQAGG